MGRVDDELLGLVVVGGGGLHLHGVVAVPELGQTKTADVIEIVNTLKNSFYFLVVRSIQRQIPSKRAL